MLSNRFAGFSFLLGISILLPKPVAALVDSLQGPDLADSVFAEPVSKPPSHAKTKPAVKILPKLKTRKGFLAIYSDPPGAVLVFNSVKQGPTPKLVQLTRKENRIVLRLPGFETYDAMIEKKTLRREWTITLKPAKSSSSSQPAPKPESLTRPKSPAKPALQSVPESKPQPSPPSDTANPVRMKIPEKTEAPVPVETPVKMGLVFFSSSPAHADIAVDGKPTGRQTPVKIELTPGIHHVEMRCDGLKGAADDSVNPGKNKALHLQLQ